MTYFSFLICQHPQQADLYLNGRPLGQIVGGQFVWPGLNPADGGPSRPVRLENFPPPCPFENLRQLRDHLLAVVQAIDDGRMDPMV